MFDPRTMSKPVYEALNRLSDQHSGNTTRRKGQKGQAVELYTYLATWGMLRLRAEEEALQNLKSNQDNLKGKQDVVKAFFQCLEDVSGETNLAGKVGLTTLKELETEAYLGLTGLGLTLAQEFSFWATAVYADLKEVD